jgi:PKD repeat protein
MSRGVAAAALAALGFLLAPGRAAANGSYLVTTVADSGPGSLRQGIADANAGVCASVCTITFSVNGTFFLTTGVLNVTGQVKIMGNGVANTKLDGSNSSGVFVLNSGSNVIQDLEIRNGKSVSGGGGIFVSPGANATLSNVDFLSNSAPGNGGGAIMNKGTLTYIVGTLTSNTGGRGGAICNTSSGRLLLQAILQSNTSTLSGGGIDNQGQLTMATSGIFNNTSATDGGGLFNSSTGLAILASVTLDGNSSGGGATSFAGGGINNKGNLGLTESTLSNNQAPATAGYGGGLLNDIGATATLTNVTISSNFAGSLGGGIKSFGSLTVDFSTIADNTGPGSINGVSLGGGSITVRDSILKGNSSNCGGSISSGGYNVSDDGSCGFAGTGDLNGTNPMLDPLGSYGGSVQTRQLQPGSPAIDRIPAPCSVGIDARFVARPQGPKCDSGAFERSTACGSITLSPAALPGGTVGSFYSLTLNATGGSAPYSFAATAGAVPPGLTVSSSGGVTGLPTARGSFVFTVTATDATSCTGSQTYAVTVGCAGVTVAPSALPAGNVGASYSVTLTTSGGNAPYSFAVTAGTLPPGLALSSAGILSGLPTTAGSFSFVVTATDSFGCTTPVVYPITIGTSLAPSIGTLTPSASLSGGAALTLTVDGSGFANGAVVNWNGSARPTTFFSPTRLTAAISASDVAAAGTFPVTVSSPSGPTSAPAGFLVCDVPGAPTNLSVQNASNPGGPVTATDPLVLSWGSPASSGAANGYEYRVNGDAFAGVAGTTVTAPARGSNDPITLFVRARSCVSGSPGTEASTPPGAYSPAPPVASFSFLTSAQAGQFVVFTDTSTPQATSWLWIFDDNATSTAQSPSHTFSQTGTHTVALVASNGSGSTVKIQAIVVAPAGTLAAEPGAVIAFSGGDPERRRMPGLRISGSGKTWLHMSGGATEETVVFLRILDEAGGGLIERRLSIEPGSEAINDVGAWGVTGTCTLELISSQPFEAALEGAEIARAAVEPPKRPKVGGSR